MGGGAVGHFSIWCVWGAEQRAGQGDALHPPRGHGDGDAMRASKLVLRCGFARPQPQSHTKQVHTITYVEAIVCIRARLFTFSRCYLHSTLTVEDSSSIGSA